MNEKTHAFPFSMIEKMMPMFPQIAIMGWMIVIISFLVGLFVLSPAQSNFFADAKAIREGAAVGSSLVNANVTAHVTEAWVPQFKFVGLGLGLMAIVMALGTVASYARWLNPLRMLGMAALFTGIVLALNVIIGTLRLQASLLVNFLGAAGQS